MPIPADLLQKPPTAAQQRLFSHVGGHLKAFGASLSEFRLVEAGRRNPQVTARLVELAEFLASSAAGRRCLC